MRTAVALVLVLAGLGATAAHADVRCQRQGVLCSATWGMQGTCNGTDLWSQWKVAGQTNPPDAFIRPWLDSPIKVVGYELTKVADPPSFWRSLLKRERTDWWFMIGSTIQPDAMLWLGPGEHNVSHFWPGGLAQHWPALADAKPVIPNMEGERMLGATGDLIDLHGTCFGGRPVTLFLTIYYTPASD